MVQHRTILRVADNSGAKSLMVIHVLAGSKRKFGYLGDVLNCVVREASPTGQVKDSEIVKAVLVRARKEHKRPDGSYIRFSDNAAVLIDTIKDKNPRGTRIFGPVAREVRDKGFMKIASMAIEVL
ncbi:MAG: 50S ribosomal protein L14 [Candidatus Levybacteria bacterium GW2011_GWA2_40_8]|nr:MAG: 50S ribosomal protein L14 [Candidatus Levybacteria bacterium GW2011_GWA2_40_8]